MGMNLRTLSPLGIIASVGGLVVLILAVWWLVTEPGRARSRAAQAELNARVAAAGSDAGAVAANAISANAEADAETDRIGRETSNAIDHAPDADVRLPGVSRAMRDGLCKRAAYRSDPLCVQPAR
jgi:type II secretory pathway component PulM